MFKEKRCALFRICRDGRGLSDLKVDERLGSRYEGEGKGQGEDGEHVDGSGDLIFKWLGWGVLYMYASGKVGQERED